MKSFFLAFDVKLPAQYDLIISALLQISNVIAESNNSHDYRTLISYYSAVPHSFSITRSGVKLFPHAECLT